MVTKKREEYDGIDLIIVLVLGCYSVLALGFVLTKVWSWFICCCGDPTCPYTDLFKLNKKLYEKIAGLDLAQREIIAINLAQNASDQ